MTFYEGEGSQQIMPCIKIGIDMTTARPVIQVTEEFQKYLAGLLQHGEKVEHFKKSFMPYFDKFLDYIGDEVKKEWEKNPTSYVATEADKLLQEFWIQNRKEEDEKREKERDKND